METTDPAKALKLIMEATGWTQSQLGRELGGRSQGWVSSVLVGRRDPGIGRFAEYLGYVGWEVVIRPQGEAQVQRREFNKNVIKVAGGSLAGRAASVLAGPILPDSPYRDPGYVMELAQRASGLREEMGGIPLAPRISAQARSVAAAIPQGGKELSVSASEFSRQAAWVFFDSGRPDLAERFARRALDLAIKGKDNERQAAAHAVLSDFFLTEGKNLERAAFHAQAGLNIPDVGEGFRTPLKGYLAWTLSVRSEESSRSYRLIDQAREVSALSSPDAGWVQHVSGVVLHNLGRDQEAFGSFERAAQFSEHEQAAHALADAAQVALVSQKLDHAAKLMSAFSYVVPLVASKRVDRKTEAIMRESARWTNVREMRLARELLIESTSNPTSTV